MNDIASALKPKSPSNEMMGLFNKTLAKYSLSEIAAHLGLNTGTVNRWTKTNNVPKSYKIDLARMLITSHSNQLPDSLKKELEKFYHNNTEREKDQFYTHSSVAKQCWEKFKRIATKTLNIDLAQYTFIEPAAGGGVFYKLLPSQRRIGIDIEPKHPAISKQDYLCWRPPKNKNKYIVIGNPPFGLRGHLALQFINYSYDFADVVGFILPQLFNSDGKGVPAKRVRGYQLAHTSKLQSNSFNYPDGKNVDVSAIFQVWTKINTHKIASKRIQTCRDYIKVYSLSDGGTPSSTRNKAMLDKCDVYLPSTCFDEMRPYDNFEKLPHRRGYGVVILKNYARIKKIFTHNDWGKTAFHSTNGALNLRTSLINEVIINHGFHDS
ncbi:hypothetical protein COTS27_01679 [Spirochaetota bacterium]|nr:hypothetical protein COTS27_01679 [Spirochaetota bacterium]